MTERDSSNISPPSTLDCLCSLWVFLAIVELTVIFTAPMTAVHEPQFRIGNLLLLLGADLTAMTFFVVVLGSPIVMASRLIYRKLPPSNWARWSARGALTLLVSLLVLVYFASWIGQMTSGMFLDREAVEFGLNKPSQVFDWISPWYLLLIPLCTLPLTLGIVWLVPWWTRTRSRSTWRITQYAVSILAGLGTIGYWGSMRVPIEQQELLADIGAISPYTLGRQFAEAREHRVGPYIHALDDLLTAIGGDDHVPVASPNYPATYRPIISIAQWSAGINSGEVKRWNVIVVIVESLRADRLKVYGSQRPVMPNCDALADQSIAFANAYTTAPHTNYANACSMSGHYPLRSTMSYLYPEHPPFPRVMIYDLLAATGYRVGMFSSQDESWGQMINYLKTDSVETFFHAETWRNAHPAPAQAGESMDWTARARLGGCIDDRYTIGEAINWIDKPDQRPFFIYLNCQASHFPYNLPPDRPHVFGPAEAPEGVRSTYFPPGTEKAESDRYDDALHYVDEQLGRLFDHLKSTGQWDHTLIVLTGDHGEAFGEHPGFVSHGSMLFQEVLRIPLVIRAPGITPAIIGGNAQSVDVPPTILHLLHLPPHPAYQGYDLLSPDRPPSRSIYALVQEPLTHQFAVIHERYKYIVDERGTGKLLFDLKADPGERINLLSLLPSVVRDMSQRLDTWRAVQVKYYSNPKLESSVYPPVMPEK